MCVAIGFFKADTRRLAYSPLANTAGFFLGFCSGHLQSALPFGILQSCAVIVG